MITYHGGPITPDVVAASFWKGRHGLISFAHPDQITVLAAVARSFVIDNGEFSRWKAGKPTDWPRYYEWVAEWKQHPGFDWAIIPDVIDGTEAQNDALIAEWPYPVIGVPVWHLHESLARLEALVSGFPRIALGSSGRWATPGANDWWDRMEEVMRVACDERGRPRTKLHGLRMLKREILEKIPFASADSSTVARNIGIDKIWKGYLQPRNKQVRAWAIGSNLEDAQHATVWTPACTENLQDYLATL